MDNISRKHRSWNMSRIKNKNTKPELIVRSLLHKMKYRFRLNGKISKKIEPKGFLPGKPDIVFAKHKCCIFINGCFWHRHKNCKYAYVPKSNKEFWLNKFNDNIERDKRVQNDLIAKGWNVEIIWECETQNIELLKSKLTSILENNEKNTRN